MVANSPTATCASAFAAGKSISPRKIFTSGSTQTIFGVAAAGGVFSVDDFAAWSSPGRLLAPIRTNNVHNGTTIWQYVLFRDGLAFMFDLLRKWMAVTSNMIADGKGG